MASRRNEQVCPNPLANLRDELFHNPQVFGTAFLESSAVLFSWGSTYAAASLAGREVLILTRAVALLEERQSSLIVFDPLHEHKGNLSSYIIDNKQLKWCPEGDLDSDTSLITGNLLIFMHAPKWENAGYAILEYATSTREFETSRRTVLRLQI